jgi:hypothetical protein
MLKENRNYGKNSVDFINIEEVTVPVITSTENTTENIKLLQDLLIDAVFCKNGYGYKTNENHLIYFNNHRFVIWINSKGFIHMVNTEKKYGDHYRLHKKNNTMDYVKDTFLDSLELIQNCINVQEKTNIYN